MSSTQDILYELENQLVLRLPPGPGRILREALRAGTSNLKDRLRLTFEKEDIRKGTLFFDNFVLPTKLVDLPCLIESVKSIDRKNVYKTADICQMLLCMEEEEIDEEPKKEMKRKDGTKVDKKYLNPHGITPPLKNARKRRFRKTLKKKLYNDQPELEKEVRRLLRADYEAAHINWELINEDEDGTNKDQSKKDVILQGTKVNEEPTPRVRDPNSDSDEDLDGDFDESRLSGMDLNETDSRLSDSIASFTQKEEKKERAKNSRKSSYVTSFSEDMFSSSLESSANYHQQVKARTSSAKSSKGEKSSKASTSGIRHETVTVAGTSIIQGSTPGDINLLTKGELLSKIDGLKRELTEISCRRQIQEAEISSMENLALRKRLETGLKKMQNEQAAKEKEISQVEILLSQYQNM